MKPARFYLLVGGFCTLYAATVTADDFLSQVSSVVSFGQGATVPLPGDITADSQLAMGANGRVCHTACNARCCGCEPWTLFPQDDCHGIRIGGWVDFGATTGSGSPANPPTGTGNRPVAFNYRRDELQMNQLCAFLEKETDTCGCGLDVGGRIDLLFGEDYIFTQAAGLETRDDGANRWNVATGGNGIWGTGQYGLALPQFYGDIAYGNLVFRLGHFYATTCYESVMAPSNFFYSHAYSMVYGEPHTYTGGMLMWNLSDRLRLSYGMVNAWDRFDGTIDPLSHVIGCSWTNYDERLNVAFSLITGDEDNTAPSPMVGNRTMYSLVFDYRISSRCSYVLQHDLGLQDNSRGAGAISSADWYSIVNYLYYTINDRWKAGLRYEWFNDDDASRVWNWGYATHWHELTLGLNWMPCPNITVRPELRFDWADVYQAGAPAGPFDDGTDDSQFLAAIDAILTF